MKIAKDGSSGSTDAYVVLKYGPKWARTRTILDQVNPRWNEQYASDLFAHRGMAADAEMSISCLTKCLTQLRLIE